MVLNSVLWTTEPGFDSQSSAVCPLGFQSKLASTGFSPGTLVFLLHQMLQTFLVCLFLSVQMALLESNVCTLIRITSLKDVKFNLTGFVCNKYNL